MRLVYAAILCLFSLTSTAQSFDWWAHVVNWDGVSEWPKYIITQPGYLGPNALPVPRISNGSIDSSLSISATGMFHFSKGDNTQNITLYGNYCLVKNVIAFDVSWVPHEHFTMSHTIKEQRHVFSHFYYDRKAEGDVQLNTTIQILNQWRKTIQLALRIGYRFPTSSGLGVARFTDAPGYYFDLSFGKPFHDSKIKWIGMIGFYSWQMITYGRRQNDAFLFGTGAEWNTKTLRMQSYIAGYAGYIGNGDKPVVFRTSFEKKIKRYTVLLNFQQGLHDFKYTTAEAGMKYSFDKK